MRLRVDVRGAGLRVRLCVCMRGARVRMRVHAHTRRGQFSG